MTKFVQLASMSALLAGTTLYVTGCECTKTEQKDPETGNTVTECESLKKFIGSEQSQTLTYTAGYDLVVESVNGEVNIEVGSGADVQVSVTPFSVRGHSKESDAKADIENDFLFEATADGRIFIDVDRAQGAFNGVGGDVTITVPAAFNGSVNVAQNNGFVKADFGGATPTSITIHNDGAGDIDVTGARGKLDLVGDFDINVDVTEWSTENGVISSPELLGSVTINVPAGANGGIDAVAEDLLTGPTPLPEGWTEEGTDLDKSYSFGTGGGVVSITSGEEITITAD